MSLKDVERQPSGQHSSLELGFGVLWEDAKLMLTRMRRHHASCLNLTVCCFEAVLEHLWKRGKRKVKLPPLPTLNKQEYVGLFLVFSYVKYLIFSHLCSLWHSLLSDVIALNVYVILLWQTSSCIVFLVIRCLDCSSFCSIITIKKNRTVFRKNKGAGWWGGSVGKDACQEAWG